MKSYISKFLFIVGIIFLSNTHNTYSKVSLSGLFGDNMVFQRNTNCSIWGLAAPNTKVVLRTSWNNKQYEVIADNKGKWKSNFLTTDAGGPYDLTVSDKDGTVKIANVLLGEVWVCSGQSNMDMPVKGFTNQHVTNSADILENSENEKIRLFVVKRRVSSQTINDVEGKWEMANYDSVEGFSAVGYLFAKKIQEKTKVPVGIIQSSWGGTMIQTWMSNESLQKFHEASNYEYDHNKNKPSALFNGMINPLFGFNIKGVIWYQGESNRLRADEYLNLFPEMVKDWREKWDIGNFPFYYVQIAPYHYAKDKKENFFMAPYMRDVQMQCLNLIENSEMVVTLDAGSNVSIHPPDKTVVGNRLSNIALSKCYNIKAVYKIPHYMSQQIANGKIILKFENCNNGLTSYYKPMSLFEIAGDDKVFYPAKARITEQGLEVYAVSVKNPVSVRYAYKPFVEAELFNTEGMPVPSFRTDNWNLNQSNL